MIRTCFLKILHRLLISKRRFLILGFLIGHCLLIGIAGNIYLPFQLCAVKHGQNLPLYNLIPFLYVHLKNLCMDIRPQTENPRCQDPFFLSGPFLFLLFLIVHYLFQCAVNFLTFRCPLRPPVFFPSPHFFVSLFHNSSSPALSAALSFSLPFLSHIIPKPPEYLPLITSNSF